MIELKNVSFAYGEQTILRDFSITVNDGQCVQLRGVSGGGKTTVARIILGLEKIESGSITVPQKISAVFQEDRLLENVDVQKNVRLPLNKEQYDFANEVLKQLGLFDVRKKRVSQLSGGMKRRVAIARAVAYGGDALILDEAFNGLDYDNKKIAADIIKKEFLSKNKPVLLITHIKEDADLFNASIVEISPNNQ